MQAMRLQSRWLGVLLTAWLSLLNPCLADDKDKIAKGKSKSIVCATCHGVDGIATIEAYPNLAGQNITYLENALKDYRDNKRQGALAVLMVPLVAALSDEDITNIATFYNSLGKKAEP